jgi:hypothetical protein
MITVNDVLRRVCSGYLVMVGEVRAVTAKETGLVDTKTGLKATAVVITYFVELMRDSFELVKITRWISEAGSDLAQVPLGAEKGKCYAFEVESVERKSGFLLARLGAVGPEEIDLREPAPDAP